MEEPQSVPLEAPQPQAGPVYVQDNSTDVTPEPSPQPQGEDQPKKPKRLTLQERLALAAKKKKKAQGGEDTSVPPSPKPAEEAVFPAPEVKEEDETEKLHREIQELRKQNQSLLEENKHLKAENAKPAPAAGIEKKLAEKDAVIQQLMEEGQALSAKEIKLHEKVRTLAATNTQLEDSLQELSKKNEDALLKLEEVNSVVKTHKLKSIDQLLEVLGTSGQELAEAQKALEEERAKNWEGKYREQQRQHEQELQEKRKAQNELNELKLQYQMSERQLQLDLKSREETISVLKSEIGAFKGESGTEIARLEAKIEDLRLENEGFLKMSTRNSGSSSGEATEAENKHIAYSEFAKLSEAHKDLQQQYVSSQENWKLIESQMLSKYETLQESSNALKKGKMKAQAELRRLNQELASQKEETEQLEKRVEALEAANKDLTFQISVKETEYAELEEKKEELTSIFNSDRNKHQQQEESLRAQVEKLEEQIQDLREAHLAGGPSVDSFAQSQSRKLRDSGLHINLDSRRISSGNSIPLYNQSMDSEYAKFEQTPAAFGNSFDPTNLSHSNLSAVSLTDDAFSYEPADMTPVPDDASAYWRGSMDRSGIPAVQGGKNIQLLSKMSANIRRLEMEVLTLKEENQTLMEEKEEVQQEIVAKLQMQEKLEALEKQTSELQKEIDSRSERETTLLELIGEKSERVEELTADVADLKALCRQQVQEMIKIAEKK